MKIFRNVKLLAAAALLSIATASPSSAAPIDLDFSFGDVSGTFFGLDNADGTTSASGFTFSGDYDYTYLGGSRIGQNSFRFSSGILQVVSFDARSVSPDRNVPFVLNSLRVNYRVGARTLSQALEVNMRTREANDTGRIGLTAENFTQVPLSAVPLPASGLLVVSGLLGFAALRRRKHLAAQP